MKIREKILQNKNIIFLILIFFIINISFLTVFPFVHSDEAWLSSMTREVLEHRSFKVTESFFDLYKRTPNVQKSLFTSMQIVFLKLFSYSIFSFRLMSLFFAVFSLFMFYKLIKLKRKEFTAVVFTILLAINIEFIYASHFARQEIVLVFILIASLYFIESNKYNKLYIILALSFFIHPNSYVIAFSVGIYLIFIRKEIGNFKEIFSKYIVFLSLAVGISLFLNFYVDSNFLYNYFNYGASLGVNSNFESRIYNFIMYFKKIYFSISGTYYIPNLKIYFYLFFISLFISLYKKVTYKYIILEISILFAFFLVGRNNTLYIVFLMPILILILEENIYSIFKNKEKNKYYSNIIVYKNFKNIIILILTSFIVLNTYNNISNFKYNDYNAYISTLREYIAKNSKVLCNLNAEYAFDNNSLLDYRNLNYLDENNISVEEYIYKNNIEYIVLSDEMEYISKNKRWNILYGDVSNYYNDLIKFIDEKTEYIAEFNSKDYGIRIVKYMGEDRWNIRIFKVIYDNHMQHK